MKRSTTTKIPFDFENTDNPITVIGCRPEHIPLFKKAYNPNWSSKGGSTLGSLDLKKLKEITPGIDEEEMDAYSYFCSTFHGLENFGFQYYKAHSGEPEPSAMVKTKVSELEESIFPLPNGEISFGDTIDVSDVKAFRDYYKLEVVGNVLLVGIHPGFGTFIDRVKSGTWEYESLFLTDCLEVCRSSMQNPALNASPLYRRFVFINVNA